MIEIKGNTVFFSYHADIYCKLPYYELVVPQVHVQRVKMPVAINQCLPSDDGRTRFKTVCKLGATAYSLVERVYAGSDTLCAGPMVYNSTVRHKDLCRFDFRRLGYERFHCGEDALLAQTQLRQPSVQRTMYSDSYCSMQPQPRQDFLNTCTPFFEEKNKGSAYILGHNYILRLLFTEPGKTSFRLIEYAAQDMTCTKEPTNTRLITLAGSGACLPDPLRAGLYYKNDVLLGNYPVVMNTPSVPPTPAPSVLPTRNPTVSPTTTFPTVSPTPRPSVPSVSVYASMWGGGGGGTCSGGNTGGGGGASRGTVRVFPSLSYTIVVGGGGLKRDCGGDPGPAVVGGGGVGPTIGYAGQGGGLSGLFSGAVPSQANAILIAGGGGGSGCCGSGGHGGGGGGLVGQSGTGLRFGTGGSQVAGGIGGNYEAGGVQIYQNGVALAGGYSASTGDRGGGGGGGGGYWGGGSGCNGGCSLGCSGAGGGSSYYNPSLVDPDVSLLQAILQTPADASNASRGTAGQGGSSGENGQPGVFILQYTNSLPALVTTGTVAYTMANGLRTYVWSSSGSFYFLVVS